MKIVFIIIILLFINLRESYLTLLKLKHKNSFKNEVNNKQILLKPNVYSNGIINFQNCPFLRCKSCLLSQCTECDKRYYLYDSKCHISCPKGTYVSNSQCIQCDSSCPICWDKYSCGLVKGTNATVVNLKDEIFDFIERNDFSLSLNERELMLENLRIILKDNFNDDYNQNKTLNLSLIEVYNGNKFRDNIDLPIYSFKENKRTFILIPGFINKGENVKSKWIFKLGYWNGFNWSTNNEIIIPSFIKEKGVKSKIYVEDNIFWYFNDIENKWNYSKLENSRYQNNISITSDFPVFDITKANNRRIKYNLYKKLDNINNKINSYLKKFEENNVIVDISKFIDEENNSIDKKLEQFKQSLSNINLTN